MSGQSRFPLSGRDFISLGDFSAEELYMFWDTAADLKRKLKRGEPHRVLEGKTLAMIFGQPSTRTRTSFETGMYQLGGHALMYSPDMYWTKESSSTKPKATESIKDQAGVFSRYCDAVMIRGNDHDEVVEFAKWADVPVINAATDYEHPCQVMADLMTTREKKGKLDGVKTAIVWAYAPFSKPLGIVNSTLFAGSKIGMDVTIACPEGYDPDPKVWEVAKKEAELSGAELTVTRDRREAVDGADVIHIKGWSPSFFYKRRLEEAPHQKEPEKYKQWIVDEELVGLAKKDVIVQHAMPAARGFETNDEVLDGPHSVILDEAENRLHAQKGVMALIMR